MEPLSTYELIEYPALKPLFELREAYFPLLSDEEFFRQAVQSADGRGRIDLPYEQGQYVYTSYSTVAQISPTVEIGRLRIVAPVTVCHSGEGPRITYGPKIYIPCLVAHDDPIPLYGIPGTTLSEIRKSYLQLRDWMAERIS